MNTSIETACAGIGLAVLDIVALQRRSADAMRELLYIQQSVSDQLAIVQGSLTDLITEVMERASKSEGLGATDSASSEGS